MSDSEKNSFIQFLVSDSRNKSRQNDCLQQTIDDLSDRLCVMQQALGKIESSQDVTHAENLQLTAQLSDQCACIKSMRSELQKALRDAAKYRGLYEVLRNEKFVGTSQKSFKSRPGRDDDKDEWDGIGNAGVDDSTSESGSVTSLAKATECSLPTSSDGTATIEVKHICCMAHVRAKFQKAKVRMNRHGPLWNGLVSYMIWNVVGSPPRSII